MKRLLLVLVLLMTAGSLFAAELKVTGDAMVRGTTWSIDDDAAADKVQYSFFDYDFNLNAALVANENATAFLKLTYDRDVVGAGTVANSSNTSVLSVERAFLNYKFHPALQLNTGLMGGGLWASDFANNEVNVMRAKIIGALSKDMVFIFTYQKNNEVGAANVTVKDAEVDDENVYFLSSRMIFGNIKVLPLLTYGTSGIGNSGVYKTLLTGLNAAGFTEKTYDVTVMAFTLGLEGDFGMLGFEFEGQYRVDDSGGLDDDFTNTPDAVLTGAGLNATQIATVRGMDKTRYGAYLNVFAKVDALKAGLIYAYASADAEDGTFSMGADFNPLHIANDWEGDALAGMSLYMAYAQYTMGKITGKAAVGYAASNMKDNDKSLIEYNASGAYAFDANTTYELGLGYATFSDWSTSGDKTSMRLYHKMSMTF